jgi:hypothetical protein
MGEMLDEAAILGGASFERIILTGEPADLAY